MSDKAIVKQLACAAPSIPQDCFRAAFEPAGKAVGVRAERTLSVDIEPLPSLIPPCQTAETLRCIFMAYPQLGREFLITVHQKLVTDRSHFDGHVLANGMPIDSLANLRAEFVCCTYAYISVRGRCVTESRGSSSV